MDGWGGRRATWCHKAQPEGLSRECPDCRSQRSEGGLSGLRAGAGAPRPGRRPCTEARRDQASGA